MNAAPLRTDPATAGDAPPAAGVPERPGWTFFTNHAHVLVLLHRVPDLRQRDIAARVGITEGAVQRILADLEDEGYIRRERIGRRNRYHVLPGAPLRHPVEAGHSVDEILDVLAE